MRLEFFHKPGCVNNEKQKRILKHTGFKLQQRDLLRERWTAETLRPFFKGYLVSECFNLSAPAIKCGSIDPLHLNFSQAIDLMIVQPILIRRPLIKIENHHILGFDTAEIERYTGITLGNLPEGIDACAMQAGK